LYENVREQWELDDAHENAQRRKTIHLRDLHEIIREEWLFDGAQEDAQRRKTVFVRSVHEVVWAERPINEAREDPHTRIQPHACGVQTRPSRTAVIWLDTRGPTEVATSSVLF